MLRDWALELPFLFAGMALHECMLVHRTSQLRLYQSLGIPESSKRYSAHHTFPFNPHDKGCDDVQGWKANGTVAQIRIRPP